MHAPHPAATQRPPHPAWNGALAILLALGLLLPWSVYLHHFLWEGGAITQFFQHATVNAVSTAITLDVYLAALGFSLWVAWERRVRRPWAYMVLCFGVGLSVALPLYLLRRRPQH